MNAIDACKFRALKEFEKRDWMRKLKNWLRHYAEAAKKLEDTYGCSIPKLIDVRIICNVFVNLSFRVKMLEIIWG